MCYNTNKGWYICATFEEMNMKKAILIIVLISLSLVSCISTKPIPPEEIIYKEITAEGYLYKEYKFPKKNEGYKVTKVFLGNSYKNNDNSIRTYFDYNSYFCNDLWVDSTEFFNKMDEKDPSWWKRITSVSDNENFNGKYILYLYLKDDTVTLYKIDRIPSQVQIDEYNKKNEDYEKKIDKMKNNLTEHTEKIHAVAQEKYNDSKNKLDAKIKDSFKEYIYHGFDNRITNAEQLINDALIPNHIYYIKNFVLDGGWGKIYSSNQNKYYYKQVAFKNREIKSVLATGITSDVIIAGDKDGAPIVIGLAEEIANEEIKQMEHFYSIIYNSQISTTVILMKFDYTENKYNQLLNELKIYEEDLGIEFNE